MPGLWTPEIVRPHPGLIAPSWRDIRRIERGPSRRREWPQPWHREAAWSQVGSTTGASGTTSAAPNKPTGAASSNLLFAGVFNDNSAGGTITLPSGWTSVVTFTGGGLRTTIAGKIADGTEGSTFTFSRSGASFITANVSCFSGNNASTLVNVNGSGDVGTASSYTASAVSTTTASTLLAYFAFPNTGSALTPPSGMTEILDAPSGFGYVAWETRAATGSTGTRAATGGGSVDYFAVLVAFEPAAAASGWGLLLSTGRNRMVM